MRETKYTKERFQNALKEFEDLSGLAQRIITQFTRIIGIDGGRLMKTVHIEHWDLNQDLFGYAVNYDGQKYAFSMPARYLWEGLEGAQEQVLLEDQAEEAFNLRQHCREQELKTENEIKLLQELLIKYSEIASTTKEKNEH